MIVNIANIGRQRKMRKNNNIETPKLGVFMFYICQIEKKFVRLNKLVNY